MRAILLVSFLIVSCVSLDEGDEFPGCDETEDYYDDHDKLEDDEYLDDNWGFRWKK